jgi:predicted ferric reductase
LAIHVGVWTIALAIEPTLIPKTQLIAELLSTFAIVFMSMNLVLSTRAGLLEHWLRGLDKLFVTHRTIGLSVAALITAHFLLVPKSVGFVWSKPFGYTTLALLLIAIFIASAPRFPWRVVVPLKYQTWKFSHRFMGVLVALAVTHSLLGHTYVKTSPLLVIYVYGVAALGLMAWLYRELAFRLFGPFHTYEVATSRVLDGDVTEVTLAPTSNAVERTAGQFAFVSFTDGPTREQHPFTISSGSQSAIRFWIKASGDYTKTLLAGLPVGSAARVEGPYGAFDYRRGGQRQLWLAGGIGITPFLSMAEDLDAERDVLLVWSVHDERAAVYGEQLSRLCGEKANLDLIVHSTSERGHVDVSTLGFDAKPDGYSVFICGPVPMRQALVRQLVSLGVARGEIHFEEFRLR